MTDAIDFERAADVLYHTVALRHAVELPVLGIPVRFESNGVAALAAVEEEFGQWRSLSAHPELISPEGVRVRLILHEGLEGAAGHTPMTFRLPDSDRFVVQTPGSVGIAAMRRRDAVAYITPALLADRARARRSVVEMLTLVLVTSCDRHPVHASVVMRGGTALLLSGPPRTGKSTLAYAALRYGLRALTDDAAYVQVEPRFRVWGRPGRVYLPLESCARFAELAGRSPERLPNGDEKVVVEVPPVSADSAAPVALRAGVCLLERTGGPASLTRAERAEVEVFLKDGLGPSLPLHRHTLGPALAHLAASGGWRLSLSDDPSDALPFIEEMLGELER